MDLFKANKLRILNLTFDFPIYSRQITNWRGAFIEMAGLDNAFFHNHKGSKEYHYRYPLIQYRIHKGKASIFAINEGADALQESLSRCVWEINWEGQKTKLSVDNLHMEEHYLRMLEQHQQYKLFKWLALNEDNYERWQQCKNLIERAALLETILTGQILGFCNAMGWRLPERLEVSLQHLNFMQRVRYHGTPMLAFNVAYTANVSLPSGIALGKGASHGYGWQVPDQVAAKKPARHEKTLRAKS